MRKATFVIAAAAAVVGTTAAYADQDIYNEMNGMLVEKAVMPNEAGFSTNTTREIYGSSMPSDMEMAMKKPASGSSMEKTHAKMLIQAATDIYGH